VIGLAQGAGGGPSTELTLVGIFALLLAAVFVQRGWATRVVVVLLVLGVAAVVAAFTLFADRSDQSGVVAGEVSDAQLRSAVASLCEARAEEDPQVAERIFVDRTHAEMHALAQALGDGHRARAAEVLEEMQRVEADIAAGSEELRPGLSALTTAAASGLRALSIEPPACAQ
jgi:hypothetical protein